MLIKRLLRLDLNSIYLLFLVLVLATRLLDTGPVTSRQSLNVIRCSVFKLTARTDRQTDRRSDGRTGLNEYAACCWRAGGGPYNNPECRLPLRRVEYAATAAASAVVNRLSTLV